MSVYIGRGVSREKDRGCEREGEEEKEGKEGVEVRGGR